MLMLNLMMTFVFSRVFANFDWSRSYLSLFTLIPLFYRCILRKASGKWELRRNSVSGLYRQPINHYIISSLMRYRGRRELVTVDGYCRLSIWYIVIINKMSYWLDSWPFQTSWTVWSTRRRGGQPPLYPLTIS